MESFFGDHPHMASHGVEVLLAQGLHSAGIAPAVPDKSPRIDGDIMIVYEPRPPTAPGRATDRTSIAMHAVRSQLIDLQEDYSFFTPRCELEDSRRGAQARQQHRARVCWGLPWAGPAA